MDRALCCAALAQYGTDLHNMFLMDLLALNTLCLGHGTLPYVRTGVKVQSLPVLVGYCSERAQRMLA